MAHGINANLVHRWRRFAQRKVAASGIAATPATPTQTFILLVIGAPTVQPPIDAQPQEVRIELRGGPFTATVS